MEKSKVIKVKSNLPKFKVGDKVSFELDGKIINETITDINKDFIEGKVYDLTYLPLFYTNK